VYSVNSTPTLLRTSDSGLPSPIRPLTDLASTYVLHPLVRLAVCPIILGQWLETGVGQKWDSGWRWLE